MARFLSREEWPLVALGITAGILTSAVVLYFFITGIGGTPQALPPEVTGDTLSVARRDARRDTAGLGVIGSRMRGIQRRLAGMPVSTRPLRGPLTLNLRDLVWNERDGTRFARAESATGKVDLTNIARGDVVIHDLVLRRTVIALREGVAGGWNYEDVLAELLDGEDDGGRSDGRNRLFQVRNLRVVDGRVDVTRPEQRFAFESIDGVLPVVSFSQPGIAEPYLRVAQISALYIEPGTETRLSVAATDALVQLPSGRARFDVAAVTLDRTRLADVRGIWDPADPGYGVTATGRALDVEFADFRSFAPERVPESGSATFSFAVRPAAPGGTEVVLTALDARSGDSRATGDVTLRFGPSGFALRDAALRLDPVDLELVERFTGPLPYGGTLVGRVTGTGGDIQFDLLAQLTADNLDDPFGTRLTGRVRLTEEGLAIQRVDVDLAGVPLAALRAVAPGLPLAGTVTGRVTLTGLPSRSPLEIDVRLELGAGVALVAGTLDLTGTEPRYDLTGTLLGVAVQAVLEPAVPPVTLTGRFSMSGAGTDPTTLVADVSVAARLTGWQTEPGDTIHVQTRLRRGVAEVDALRLRLATAALEARGTWRFIEPVSGAVTYALEVTSMRPFGPYLPVIGDTIAAGSLRASGTVTGPLASIRLTGDLAGTDLRVGGWRAASLATRYDVTRGTALPRATVVLEGTGIATPTAGEYETARGSLQLQPPDLRLDVRAERAGGGMIEVFATGDVPTDGPRRIVLERAVVDLGDGRWTLQRPARIDWTGSSVAVHDLAVEREDGVGRIMVDGQVLPLEEVDARVQVVELPVGEVQRLAGLEPRLEGLLSIDGVVRGGATAPQVDVTFSVRDGVIEQVPVQRLEGRVQYANEETVVQASVATDTAGSLTVDARLPSRLRLAADPRFDLIEGLPLEGTLTASRFSIRPFRVLLPQVRELHGLIDGSASLAGTAEAPRLQGAIALRDGQARVPALNQTFTEIAGEIGFTDRRLVIEDLRARSDGWIVARGQIVFESLTRPVVEIIAELQGFRPMGVPDQRDAAVFGEVNLRGPPSALVLTGGVRAADGYVILPEFRGGFDAELIDITRPAPTTGAVVDMDAGADWMRNLRVADLRVQVADNVWIMAQEARVQLSGELTVNKAGEELPIVGTLQGTRGQYTLVAGPILRRFDIVSAQIRFLGAPRPNPAVDITARRIIIDAGGRPLDVDVRITGTLENPTLQIAGGGLALPESELLSFLLFGQPTFALGGDFIPGENLLQQTFWGGFAELAAIELERSLGGLGLDLFQVRFGAGPFGGIGSPTFVVGRQLASDVFITLETALTALFGDAETPVNWWAARLDWTFDSRSRARLAWEPVYRGRSLRGATTALPFTELKQQLLLELRRRWSW